MARKGDLPSESCPPDDSKFTVELEALKVRIGKIEGSQYPLRKLIKAGADRNKLLLLLALAAQSAKEGHGEATGMRREESLADIISKRRKDLVSLAQEMDCVAERTDRLLNEPRSYAGPWFAVLGIIDDYKGPDGKKRHQNPLPMRMRSFATNLRAEASNLEKGVRVLRRERRTFVSRLILYVREATGKSFDREIAFLLSDAFRANGQPGEFSEDRIKKHRHRHVNKLLSS